MFYQFYIVTAILPYREDASPQTREFLARVVDVLLDYVQKVNDRNEKVGWVLIETRFLKL